MKKINGRGKMPMNRTVASGTIQEAKGKVETAVGHATGNQNTVDKGQLDVMKGKGKRRVGQVQGTIDNAINAVDSKIGSKTK